MEAEKYNYILFKMIAENCGKTVEEVLEVSRRDKWFNSDEAKEFGLIDEIHPADEITAAAEKLATSLATGSTPSASAVKLLCNKTFGDDLKTHLDLERQSILTLSGSADAAEGIAAFIEKRQPLFRD
jgi:2-(1,2-epoxy-1,2-dihydrophenyl)acetyl-CoA isomerase